MNELTLRQLRYALALAQEGHFSRAAARCFVTQSALSQQIRLLEAHCGAKLFVRRSGSVHPTSFGRDFLDQAKPLVREADRLQAFAMSRGGRPDRPVRFGLIPTAAPYLLPEIYPRLVKRFPDVSFTISESRTERLLQNIEEGKLDLALIATDPPTRAGLTEAPLFADPFVLATAKGATLPDPVRLADLDPASILLLDEGHCLRDQAMDACALSDGEAAEAFAATSLGTIVEFVANGQGVTLLPTISLKKEAASDRVALHPLAAPGASRLLRLTWHETSPYGQFFAEIAAIIGEAGSELTSRTLPKLRPELAA